MKENPRRTILEIKIFERKCHIIDKIDSIVNLIKIKLEILFSHEYKDFYVCKNM